MAVKKGGRLLLWSCTCDGDMSVNQHTGQEKGGLSHSGLLLLETLETFHVGGYDKEEEMPGVEGVYS